MGLKYRIVQSSMQSDTGKKKPQWYPQLTGSQKIDLNEVAGILSKQTTASKGDVYLVVTALTDLIPELLMDGNTVHLGKLGSFRLWAKATPAEDPEKTSYRNIKELRVAFIPAKEIKKKLKNARFRKVKRS